MYALAVASSFLQMNVIFDIYSALSPSITTFTTGLTGLVQSWAAVVMSYLLGGEGGIARWPNVYKPPNRSLFQSAEQLIL